MKILLSEDDADTAAYIVGGLTEEGHVVDHAADGRDGLFLAAGESYDLMIVDRRLPRLDGLAIQHGDHLAPVIRIMSRPLHIDVFIAYRHRVFPNQMRQKLPEDRHGINSRIRLAIRFLGIVLWINRG